MHHQEQSINRWRSYLPGTFTTDAECMQKRQYAFARRRKGDEPPPVRIHHGLHLSRSVRRRAALFAARSLFAQLRYSSSRTRIYETMVSNDPRYGACQGSCESGCRYGFRQRCNRDAIDETQCNGARLTYGGLKANQHTTCIYVHCR